MENVEREEKTIDLKTLLLCLLDRVWLIILVSVICAAAVGIYTKLAVDNKYTSTATMFVQNKDTAAEDSSISSSDVAASASLVKVCQKVFTSDSMIRICQEELAKAGYVFTEKEIQEMINIVSEDNNQVMTVNAVSESPEISQLVASVLVTNADSVYKEIVKIGSVQTISAATFPEEPSSPDLKKNMLLGFAAGFVLICAIVVIIEICDTKIKPSDNLMEMYGVPLIAEIMDFDSEIK